MRDRSPHPALRPVLLAALLLGGRPGPVPAQVEAEALSGRFRQASRQVLPAVVTVRPLGVVSPFGGEVAATGRGGGSGVVVDAARGLVVTNHHVVAGATRGVVVVLPDGRERPASQVWPDPKSDLALLAVEPGDLVAAAWGDDRVLDIGDWVLAVGGPFGLSGTVTAGIVSGKGRAIGAAFYEDLIQTDAAINPGNSGGPLINLRGEVVGIATALKTNGGGFEGVGFAVPASRARRVVAELAESGRVRRAYLGITMRPVDPAAARLDAPGGVVVASVVAGGPAAAGGILPGDVIVALGGRPAGGVGGLQAAVEVAPVGFPLDLTVVRNGQSIAVQVRPEPQPDGFGLGLGPAIAPGIGPVPTGVVVPDRPRGLRINVPGVDMVVPGPNLEVNPFGLARRRPGEVIVPPAEVVVPGPVPTPPPAVVTEPQLRPLDPTPAPEPIPAPTTRTAAPADAAGRANFPDLGLDLAEPTPALVDRFRLDRGATGLVIVNVVPGGVADRGGLEAGMLLTDAGGRLVGNLDDLRRILAARPAGRDLLVRIRKGTKAEFRVIVAPDAPPGPADPAPSLDPPATVPALPGPRPL